MKCRALICTVLLAVLALGGVHSGPSQQKDDPPKKKPADGDQLAKLGKARLDAAELAYKTWVTKGIAQGNLAGESPISVMTYELSIRWLTAELDLAKNKEERIAAHAAHLERMKGWYKAWDGDVNSERLALPLVDSFRKEGEYWLAKEQSGKE
jgi:predicted ABC-class ATPase